MSGLLNNSLFLSTAAAAGGYQVSRSLRFNSSDSAYLSRTPAVAGNRKTWTWAGWVKRSALGTSQMLLSVWSGYATELTNIQFNSDDTLTYYFDTAANNYRFTTTQVFRDCSSWYHLLVAVDTTQAVNTNRAKLYVNGSQVTVFSQYDTFPLNSDTFINSTNTHNIGRYSYDGTRLFNGYIAECYLIDGQQLTPSSFTEVSATTGQLIPLAYSGSFGTNGFWLKFSDNSAATAATLGKDYSGNSNNWTPNNLSVTAGAGNDSLVDTPTSISATDTGVGGEVRGNYCIWNPLNKHSGVTLSNGNLDFSNTALDNRGVLATIGVTSGKFYIESFQSTGTADALVTGFIRTSFDAVTNVSFPTDSSFFGYTYAGRKWSFTAQSNGNTSLVVGSDILCFAIDLDAGKAWAGKNGVWFSSGNPATGANPYWTFTANTPYSYATVIYNATGNANFGQRAFAYTAPSGFKALCDTNLGAPLVAKPNTLMDVVLYTGNGSTQTISGLAFSPDFVWYKSRVSAVFNHGLFDIVRGAQNFLASNSTAAEVGSLAGVSAFNSDGFTLGSDAGGNTSAASMVAWAWDAGTSTVSNTAGSITSQVRANASAGFSVVSYTGTGAVATVGHGLGVAPQLIIARPRNAVSNWVVYHASEGAGKFLRLNTTDSSITDSTAWNNTTPTSTVYSVGNNAANGSGLSVIAYCFSPVVGYSSMGSYVGNGSSEGPFVYTGFRPKWILYKRTDTTGYWLLADALRNGFNPDNNTLCPNLSDAEDPTDVLDILSNGFKLRVTGPSSNASGGTYIFAAFAENPFQYARAR